MDEYYSIVFVYHKQMTWITQVYTHTYIFFSYSSVDGHLGCLHVLAIVNSVAVNIRGARIFLNYSFIWI